MDSLVDVAWLQSHLKDPDLRILDCTVAFELGDGGTLSFYSGQSDWETEHIPGSAFADILTDLSDTESPHQFTLPSASQFAAAMGALGVGEGTRVVLYDSTYTMWATRVWWMLRAFGFSDASVLNGGLTAWRAAGAPTSNEVTAIPAASFKARLEDGWFVNQHEVREAVDDSAATCIIDALMPDMYTGTQQPYSRAGHLPGAINVPAVGVVHPDTRLFLDETTLRELFAPALSDAKGSVITYCGGGIAATADAFLLHRLGKQDVTVYDGSMAQWSADENMPLVVGGNPS